MLIVKEDVLKLLQKERKANFVNQLWSVIWDRQVPTGEIRNNKILYWSYDWFNPIAYLVFIFEFDTRENLVKVKAKLTSYNKLMFGLIVLTSMAYAIWVGYGVSLESSNYIILLIIIVFDFLCLAFALNLYKVSKHNQLVDLRDRLTQIAQNRKKKISDFEAAEQLLSH